MKHLILLLILGSLYQVPQAQSLQESWNRFTNKIENEDFHGELSIYSNSGAQDYLEGFYTYDKVGQTLQVESPSQNFYSIRKGSTNIIVNDSLRSISYLNHDADDASIQVMSAGMLQKHGDKYSQSSSKSILIYLLENKESKTEIKFNSISGDWLGTTVIYYGENQTDISAQIKYEWKMSATPKKVTDPNKIVDWINGRPTIISESYRSYKLKDYTNS